MNAPTYDPDEIGFVAGTVIKMISNFFWGMVGGMLGLYLANITVNIANGKKDFYNKNDSWGTYIAEGVKGGAFAILGSKLVYKITAVIGAAILKQIVDIFFDKTSFSFWGLLTDILIGIGFVLVIHFGPIILSKLSRKQKKSSAVWIEKLKEMIQKIVEFLISKMRNTIDKLVAFFQNTFVKRFSISNAKRIGKEFKKIFA